MADQDQMQNPDQPQLPETIRAFDEYGRPVLVPREQWAAEVLPNMIKETRDNPDQLYGLIINSLNDGFLPQVTEAAEHLYLTDPNKARGSVIWSVVLMSLNRFDEAEQILTAFPDPEPNILLNLAKVQAQKGETALADATLQRSLALEPNLDNALGWFATQAGERAAAEAPEADRQSAGEAASRAALEQIAAMPQSWRAQLWLARLDLGAQNLGSAKAQYKIALERAPRPLPPDFLMQLSGDLGNMGLLRELIEYTAPEFVPQVHGLPIGNNLIKAFVDTGNLDHAATVKDALYALNRPDWKESLSFWDGEIARRRIAGSTANQTQPSADTQIQIGMLRIDGPIWLPSHSPARTLFAEKSDVAPSVTFLGGTAEAPESPEAQAQLSEAVGRLTRSLPLFFAEQVEMRTAAAGRAMLPFAVPQPDQPANRPSGFVVSGDRWPDAAAVQMVSEPSNLTDYVVTVHVDAEVEPWTAELAFIRTADGQRIGELQAEFPPADPGPALHKLTDEVVDLLAAFGDPTPSPAYQLPSVAPLGFYLLRLEQLLAVRCTTVQGAAPMPLSGEREMLDGDLDLCLADPTNIPVRLLLIETLGTLTTTNPQATQEFQPKFQRLLAEHPIPTLDALFQPPQTVN